MGLSLYVTGIASCDGYGPNEESAVDLVLEQLIPGFTGSSDHECVETAVGDDYASGAIIIVIDVTVRDVAYSGATSKAEIADDVQSIVGEAAASGDLANQIADAAIVNASSSPLTTVEISATSPPTPQPSKPAAASSVAVAVWVIAVIIAVLLALLVSVALYYAKHIVPRSAGRGYLKKSAVTPISNTSEEPESDHLSASSSITFSDLSASGDAVPERPPSRGHEKFRSAIGDAIPWSLESNELTIWLEEKLGRQWPSADFTLLLDALAGLGGVDLLDLCDETSSPPWVKLKKGPGRILLTHVAGVTWPLVGNLNELLNTHGIGYYALLMQTYHQSDRLSPMISLVWEEKLGEGSFGQVPLVRNKHSNTRTAVKLIKVEDAEKLDTTVREMQAHQIAAKSSEYVVDILNWSQFHDEFMFIELGYCAGGDIRKLLVEAGAPDSGLTDNALRWKLYGQISQGLETIHACKLIHLDVKPANG